MHRAVYVGHLVYVRLKTGERFVERFLRSTSKWVEISRVGRIQRIDLKTLTLHRHQSAHHGLTSIL